MTIAVESSYDPVEEGVTSIHDQLWAAGDISADNGTGSVTFTPSMVGVFDWGSSAYAAAGAVIPYKLFSLIHQRLTRPFYFLGLADWG